MFGGVSVREAQIYILKHFKTKYKTELGGVVSLLGGGSLYPFRGGVQISLYDSSVHIVSTWSHEYTFNHAYTLHVDLSHK